jgi:hypothetical protein
MALQRTIKAVVRPGEESGFREAVALHPEGDNLASLGLAADPTILVTLELTPTRA